MLRIFDALLRIFNTSFIFQYIIMCRACNLTAFIPCLTGPVDYPFASCYEGPGLNPQAGTYVKPGFSY